MSGNYERSFSSGDGEVLTADSSDGTQSFSRQETSYAGSENDEHDEEELRFLMEHELDSEE